MGGIRKKHWYSLALAMTVRAVLGCDLLPMELAPTSL